MVITNIFVGPREFVISEFDCILKPLSLVEFSNKVPTNMDLVHLLQLSFYRTLLTVPLTPKFALTHLEVIYIIAAT